MTKAKDDSEQVRVKTKYAVYVREEGDRLGKNFLDTLYWIIDNYRLTKENPNELIPKSTPIRDLETLKSTSESIPTIKDADLNVSDFE